MADRQEARFPLMGTDAHLVVLGADAGALDQARRRLDDLERRWSRFRPESEICRLNRSPGRPVVVSDDTYQVLSAAVEAWAATDGRFDPTIGSTMRQAGYDRPRQHWTGDWRGAVDHQPSPTPAAITFDPYPRSVTVPPGISLDLGGIGKGAAADLVAEELLASGVDGCCVSIGGDLRVAGRPPSDRGWRIELDAGPPPPDRSPGDALVLGVVDGAVCTSTSLRRTWRGRHGAEHHLRDPATGRSLSSGLSTVSVVAARALQAEVLATLAFASGPVEGGRLIEQIGATGVLVGDDGEVQALAGLRPFLAAGAAAADHPEPRPVAAAAPIG